MESVQYDAFWSYTHEDNDRSGGRVLAFAESVRDEFALTTGDELELFLDRTSLKWGDTWRERVDLAIGTAPFFIPIVTPKFVRSEECRREFLAFSSMAKSRNLDKLLLPILYIPVPGLNEDSDDEVLALLARTQYIDWTQLRLTSTSDASYLRALNQLALTLRQLQVEVSESTLVQESRTDEEKSEDLQQTIREIELRLEPWMESVDFDKVAGRTWRSVRDERLARVQRLVSGHAGRSAIFSTLVRLGQELLPIAQNRLEKAKDYARLTIELDPLVNRAIRLISQHPELSGSLNSLRDGVNEAYLNIEPSDPTAQGYGLPANIVSFNKHLTEADQAIAASYTFVKEGNELVLKWRQRLLEMEGDPTVRMIRNPETLL